MVRMFVLALCAAAAAYAQKGGFKMPPEVVPPGFMHPDALSDSAHFQKQFENERTRVLRAHLAPDETSKTFESPGALFVCFKECHVRLVEASGHDQDIHLQDRETRWVWMGTRSLKNLSTHPVDMLIVEFKGEA